MLQFFVLLGLVVAAVVVFVSALLMYHDAERQSLLWALVAAAEREIPLETAARALARERGGGLGARALNLAACLEAGVPFPLALKRSFHFLPPALLLAADLGVQTGSLAAALRQVIARLDEFAVTLRSVLEKLFYLLWLVLFTVAIVAYTMVAIVPVFADMFKDFELALPRATMWLLGVSRFCINYWGLLAPLLLALAAEALLGLLHYAGLSRRNAPIVGRLCRRPDNALIMRWLAIAVRQERPIGEIVRLLAGSFPQPAVRAKLQRAARRIDQGADWRESLRRERLIDRLEAAVFQSAERVGNLAWALDEMADSCARRAAYRMRARLNVAFPVVVLAFGGCVFLILAGILMPLFSLI